MKQFKQILLIGILLFCIESAFSQAKKAVYKVTRLSVGASRPLSRQAFSFQQLTARAGVTFSFPTAFREIKAPENEYFSFDYAMELPGKEFEIWFNVRSQKENWASYEKSKTDKGLLLENPDSLYVGLGNANAVALTGERNFFVHNISSNMLSRYHGDAGKSYLLTLPDVALTKHYRYALLLTLQKAHTGTIMAVCLANEKGPEFYKDIDQASNCIRFK